MSSKKTTPPGQRVAWPAPLDGAVGLAALAFVVLISLFAIRNNDIWWHMAVGRELLAARDFMTRDPFMFSVTNAPWVPHSWLADILLYALHAALSVPGLVVLRALLVATTFLLVLRLLRRLGVSLTLAAPVFLVAVLNAHSRFILRPHLFEYLFVVVLLGYLVTRRGRAGAGFFVLPVALQVLWVNLHPSFYIGIVMVVLFYVGEWATRWLPISKGSEGFLGSEPVPWRRVALLVLLMGAASLVNPSPREFVLQPLGAENREMLTRYTLEWRAPFEREMKAAAFHPYYEILLGFVAAAFVLAWGRIRIASLLLVAFFALMSLYAHRFRVEFCLVAVPLVLDQLKAARVTEALRRRLARSGAAAGPYMAAVVVALVLVVTARDRMDIDVSVEDRFPGVAFEFVRSSGVAMRPFHTIGFGSYLIWDLYPDRRTFIDGRQIDVGVHKDFLIAQTASQGFNAVARKYALDAFILPVPEKSDGGMSNLHHLLIAAKNWTLAHMDHVAYVYVKNNTVPAEWLGAHGYRYYHPMTFQRQLFSAAQLDSVAAELRRATVEDSLYVRPWLDSGRFFLTLGDSVSADRAVRAALALDPDNALAKRLRRALHAPRP